MVKLQQPNKKTDFNVDTKLNFYKNDSLVTSNYLQNDEYIYEKSDSGVITTEINFSLHVSRIQELSEGNYDLILQYEKDKFEPIFVKEISPSRTEIRIGLNQNSNKEWSNICLDPDLFWKDINKVIVINNYKYRIINAVPDYSDINENIQDLSKQISNTDNKEDKRKLKNLRDKELSKVTFLLKLNNSVNNSITTPYIGSNTYMTTEPYSDIKYDNVYIYEPEDDDVKTISLSNDTKQTSDAGITELQNYQDLVSTYSSSLNTFISKSLDNRVTSINTDFTEFKNYSYFGSAEFKLKNVYNKIKNIEQYSNIAAKSSASEALNTKKQYIEKVNEIEDNMTNYENFVYTESSSYAWPKYYGSSSAEYNYSYSSSTVDNWYNNLLGEAEDYDNDNISILTRNIPEGILEHDESSNLENLLYVWGDFFDYIKNYIDQIPYMWNTNQDNINSIPDDLLSNYGDILQQPLFEGYDTDELPSYVLGKELDSGSKALQNITREKWKRLINDLPYINKIKGTKRSINSLLNIYGIPSSILTIKEYGGGNKTTGSAYINEDKNTYVLDIQEGQYLRAKSSSYQALSGSDFTYELRFKTDIEQNMQLIGNSTFNFTITTGSNFASNYLFDDKWINAYLIRSGSNIKMGLNYFDEDRLTINSTTGSLATGGLLTAIDYPEDEYIYFYSDSFTGSAQEVRMWDTALTDKELDHHAYDFDSVATSDPETVNDHLVAHFKLNDNHDLSSNTYVNDYNRNEKYDADAIGFTGNQFQNITLYDNKTLFTNFNTQLLSDNKINIGKISGSATLNSNIVELMFSPTKYINDDILSEFAMYDFSDAIGKPSDMYESNYETLDGWRKYYFTKFGSNYNYFAFTKFIRNFDKSVFDMVESILPERVKLRQGLIVKPNLLERSKYEWQEPESDDVEINFNDTIYYTESIDYTAETDIRKYDSIEPEDEIPLSSDFNIEYTDKLAGVTGSLESEYQQYEVNKELERSSSNYDGVMPTYTGDSSTIRNQIDYLCYKGSENNENNDYNNEPVIVSESYGTMIVVE